MNKKIIITMFTLSLFITGFLIFEAAEGNLEEFLFDQIPYAYKSYISLPSNSPSTASIGGYYKFYGMGRDFNFEIVLPGIERYEYDFNYRKEGIKGKGRIDKIDITYKTILAILSADPERAMLETGFSGTFDMSCASWNGFGNFSNTCGKLTGNFEIIGAKADHEGKFDVIRKNDGITIVLDYIYYPHAQKSPENIKRVKQTFYM